MANNLISDLIDRARQHWTVIKNEKIKRANTAERVGSAGLDLVESISLLNESIPEFSNVDFDKKQLLSDDNITLDWENQVLTGKEWGNWFYWGSSYLEAGGIYGYDFKNGKFFVFGDDVTVDIYNGIYASGYLPSGQAILDHSAKKLGWYDAETWHWKEVTYDQLYDAVNSGGGGEAPIISNVDFENKLLLSRSRTMIDWENGLMDNQSEETTIDWHNRRLYDGNYNIILDWDIKQLQGAGGIIELETGAIIDGEGSGSIDWRNRILCDIDGRMTVDWGNKVLVGSEGYSWFDWNSNFLVANAMYIYDFGNGKFSVDGGGVIVDWDSRILHSYNQANINWNTGLVMDNENMPSIDLYHRQLTAGWMGGGTIDWDYGIMMDNAGTTSIDYSARNLLDRNSRRIIRWWDGLGFWNQNPLTAQPAAIADATNTTDIITQFNTLLGVMRSYGLIAT